MIFAPLHTGFMGLMGALDSVAVSVGTSPPTISLQPLGDTAISVGDRVELVITAAAGTGALAQYALYKNGILLRVEATAVTTKTFVFESFKTTNEGEYFIRVTQASGAYKDSDKVELRLYHVNADGSQKPVIETKTTQDVSTIPTTGGTGVLTGVELVEVDGWQYIYESKIFGHKGAVDSRVEAEARSLADQYYPGGPGSVTVSVLKSASGFYGTIWTPDP